MQLLIIIYRNRYCWNRHNESIVSMYYFISRFSDRYDGDLRLTIPSNQPSDIACVLEETNFFPPSSSSINIGYLANNFSDETEMRKSLVAMDYSMFPSNLRKAGCFAYSSTGPLFNNNCTAKIANNNVFIMNESDRNNKMFTSTIHRYLLTETEGLIIDTAAKCRHFYCASSLDIT